MKAFSCSRYSRIGSCGYICIPQSDSETQASSSRGPAYLKPHSLHQISCLQRADAGWRTRGDHIGDFGAKAWEWAAHVTVTEILWTDCSHVAPGITEAADPVLWTERKETWHSFGHSCSDVCLIVKKHKKMEYPTNTVWILKIVHQKQIEPRIWWFVAR